MAIMKILNGKELAEFIQERQRKQVAALGFIPKLAIIQTVDDEVIDTYVRLKINYGADIGVDVEKHFISAKECEEKIAELNSDKTVKGIIVQLPLDKSLEQEKILDLVAKDKDVDGLSSNSPFDPATPIAIMWLLSGFNVETKGRKIAIIGQGPLVGSPLKKIFDNAGLEVLTADNATEDVASVVSGAEIIISATGQPGLVSSEMINENSVVIDAGVAVASGRKVGDLDEDVYAREDLTITPKKGGVGPLTVCALFENVIKAAQASS